MSSGGFVLSCELFSCLHTLKHSVAMVLHCGLVVSYRLPHPLHFMSRSTSAMIGLALCRSP